MIGLLNNPDKTAKIVEIQRQLVNEIYAPCTILTEQDNWNDYQYLIVNDHGGKPGPLIAARVEKLVYYATSTKGTIVKGPLLTYDIEQLLSELSWHLPPGTPILELPIERVTNKRLLGDCHAISVWPGPDHNIDIRPQQTLASFLDNPEPADWYYFGNEDIRHYLCKIADNPIKTTKDLAKRYIDLARKYNAKVTCLLPVESEKRIIDKKYWVDGKPFYGPRGLRVELVELFNNIIRKSGLEVHEWPSWWYEKPYLYETTIMDKKPTPLCQISAKDTALE